MLQSGEDPLYIARRLIVIASEDVGLADNSLLSLATAAHDAVEKIGLPEARINLAHATVALALAPKSTRAYRAFGSAAAACEEPGVAGLPVPMHLRNAPTRLMRELGYGKEYKYPPDYRDGKVVQEVCYQHLKHLRFQTIAHHIKYLPDELRDRKFLDDIDLGTKVDTDYTD
jgi:putative ATPase